MWNTLACFLYLLNFEVIQLFVVFKCVKITNHRKACFWSILIYTLIFKTIEFYINAQPDFNQSQILHAAVLIVHAIDTFILLGLINFFSDEYLPRNFILVSFYYDFLTIIPLTNFVGDIISEYLNSSNAGYSTFYYDAEHPAELLMILCITTKIILIALVSFFFNKRIKSLLQKIPDSICLLIMSAFFMLFIIKNILNLKTDIFAESGSVAISLFYFDMFLIVTSAIIVLLFVIYSLQSQKYKKLQKTESSLLLTYYLNVSEVYREVRSMKHDIANHLAIINATELLSDDKRKFYKDQLLETCNEIDHKLDMQMSWKTSEDSFLSNRERYEIFNYISGQFKKHHISSAKTTVSLDYDNSEGAQKLRYHTCCDKISKLKLIRIKYAATHFLIKEIVQQHNCTLLFTNDNCSCTIILEKKPILPEVS